MTFNTNLRPSSRASDSKDTATHQMSHDGRTLARKGDDGNIELWSLGQWVIADYRNSDLAEPLWFKPLPGTLPPQDDPEVEECL